MTLVHDWRRILRYAWSVRLIALAGLLTGAEALLPFLFDAFDARVMAFLTFFIVMAALVARLIAQQSISGAGNEQA